MCAPHSNVPLNFKVDLDNPNMVYTSMVSTVVANDNSQAISPYKAKEHSKGSFRQRTFININNLISLSACKISGKSYLCQDFQKQLQNLSHKLVEHHQRQIMIQIKKVDWIVF